MKNCPDRFTGYLEHLVTSRRWTHARIPYLWAREGICVHARMARDNPYSRIVLRLIPKENPVETPEKSWWSVRLVWNPDKPVTDDTFETLAGLLTPLHAAVAAETPGRVSIEASVEALGMEDALRHAMAATEEALRRTGTDAVLTKVDALSEEEWNRQQEQARAERALPDLYGTTGIASLLGIPVSKAVELMDTDEWRDNTTAVHTLRSGPVYTLSQIERYLHSEQGDSYRKL